MYRFEELDVWKASASLSVDIYQSLNSLKDFGFKDQITRSGLSIPSNITEGYERDSSKEAVNFIRYAKGSAGELRTQIYVGMKIGYIETETGKRWLQEAEKIIKMLSSLKTKYKNLK